MVKIYSFTHSNDVNSLIMYIDNALSKKYQQEIFTYLESMTDFEKGNSYFGEIPRLQKWYQRNRHYFHFYTITRRYFSIINAIADILEQMLCIFSKSL